MTPKTIIFAAVLATSVSATLQAQTIFIDFGPSGGETAGNWNNATSSSSTLFSNLIDSTGANTGFSLTQSNASNFDVAAAKLTGSDLTEAVANTGQPATAVEDQFFIRQGTSNVLQLTGMNPAQQYELSFFSGIDLSRPANSTEFTIVGASGGGNLLFSPTGNTEPQAVLVTPDGSGVISITASAPVSGNAGHWNSLAITTIPEPGTYALFAGVVAFTALIVRRRVKR